MEYDRGEAIFPFDFEANGIPFGSKSKGKLSPQSYSTQFKIWKSIFVKVRLILQSNHLKKIDFYQRVCEDKYVNNTLSVNSLPLESAFGDRGYRGET